MHLGGVAAESTLMQDRHRHPPPDDWMEPMRPRQSAARKLTVSAAALLATVGWCQAAMAASKPPGPAFHSRPGGGDYLAAVTSELRAGDVGSLSIHVAGAARCALALKGPDGLSAGPFRARVPAGFGTWRWQVPTGARGGRWRAVAVCTRANRKASLRSTLNVGGGSSGTMVITAAVKFRHSRTAPRATPQLVGGRGGGGYPDDNAVDCSKQFGIYSWCKKGTWLSPRRFAYRNCTDFVAWFLGLTWSSFRFSAHKGDAANWKAYAANAGLTARSTPSVGDVAWWGAERARGFGHVAIVTAVGVNGTVTIAEYNGDGHGNYDIRPNQRADAYLHPNSGHATVPIPQTSAPASSQAAGPVFPVQNTSETPPDGVYFRNGPHTADTSATPGLGVFAREQVSLSCFAFGDAVGAAGNALWYRVTNMTRPTTGGQPNAGWLSAHYVNDGKTANEVVAGVPGCTGYSTTPPPGAPPLPPAPPPPPAPQTWAETTGGVAHTWTNYTNAGGTQGPSIGANQTVQIACKLHGFAVADGNTWWYRIVSAPWNAAFYVSADAFYNNGATSGSLHGTPFVDPAVSDC
jgi:surface antigen